MLKTDKKTESMANEAINHKIKLTVKNGKYDITLEKQEIDKLMKELGTDNAIQIIGLLAIAKGELEAIKERKLI